MVDNKKYDLDIVPVGKGIYSILVKNRSFNVEVIESKNARSYIVQTFYQTFDVEVQDAETRYMMKRGAGSKLVSTNVISSPMPGRIVKVLVETGQKIVAGQTAVIISAMKMESEYKVHHDAVIKDILVKEGDIVYANQPLIILE